MSVGSEPVQRRSGAAGPGEFPGLEAFFAEHRAPLRRPEGGSGVLATGRAAGLRFDPFAGHPATGRPGGALALTGFAPLRLVLEVLVGEELLFSRRPDELRTAIHARENPVLELHRSLPRRGRSIPSRAATFSDSASGRGPAWPVACRPVSSRRNAS